MCVCFDMIMQDRRCLGGAICKHKYARRVCRDASIDVASWINVAHDAYHFYQTRPMHIAYIEIYCSEI